MAHLQTIEKLSCYHCGESCEEEPIKFDEKVFCCTGCKLVYEVLLENNLCTYYSLSDQPGKTQKISQLGDRFAYLDEKVVADKLIRFRDQNSVHLRFHIPNMHCSSCIWLLEHMGKIDPGVIRSQVDFIQKELLVVFDPTVTSIRKVVERLVLIGYEPELNFEQINSKDKKRKSRIRIYRIGIAGFAFGNIMLLSFPAYFSDGAFLGQHLLEIFGYLNFVLSLPVFFFSAGEFMNNAWLSFRQKTVNIDVPIAIGIIAMMLRSCYEIFTGIGPGYFDSMTGLVFFMLIGRNFQDKTYQWLSFDRDYKSYFPIAVTRLKGTSEESVPVNDLQINDRLRIRSMEIVPADVMLLEDSAEIDYSFVTGESNPVIVSQGDRIFAGARLVGSPAEVLVQQEVSHSYLTRLWNQKPGEKEQKSGFQKMTEMISRWFVLVTFSIAIGAFLYWTYHHDGTRAINAFTTVLVIACACALALSAPFTFGNMLRILGKKGIYLKNAHVLERLADLDEIVFDKTGTLTEPDQATIEYEGDSLSKEEKTLIRSLASSSYHPLSRMLAEHLKAYKSSTRPLDVQEAAGLGIQGKQDQLFIRIGSASYTQCSEISSPENFRITKVHIQVNGTYKGYYSFRNRYRKEANDVARRLAGAGYKLSVISGDNEGERPYLTALLPYQSKLQFNQTPADKLRYVQQLQQQGKKVMMVGDGLNDAGALMQSNAGMALSADINNFSPACDGIVLGNCFGDLPNILRFSKAGIRIIIISFIISLGYNFLGLWFAVQGTLSPVIAAILMPISTSSLVVYTVVASSLKARQLGLRKKS